MTGVIARFRRHQRVALAALAAAPLLLYPRAGTCAPKPWDHLGTTAENAVSVGPLILYGGAVAETIVLSASGADHEIRVAVLEHVHAPFYGDMTLYGGYVLPIVAPGVYLAAVIAGDDDGARAGAAATQAVVLTVVMTTSLKVGTGRPYPDEPGDELEGLDDRELSKEFSPFAFDGRYAWPSGHTAQATTMAAAFTAYTRSWAVGVVGYAVALGVGFGMIVGDEHWTSDVIAGGLIGHAVGWSAGSAFRDANTEKSLSFRIVPFTSARWGIGAAAEW
jgi:membrane-associated phospholipid phosphatase